MAGAARTVRIGILGELDGFLLNNSDQTYNMSNEQRENRMFIPLWILSYWRTI